MPAASDRFEGLLSQTVRRATPFAGSIGQQQPEFPFAFGLPDPGSFPNRQLLRVARSIFGEQGRDALQYGNFQGDPGLRQVVAERLLRLEGVHAPPDAILITNGSSHAIALMAQALVDPGDTIVVEGPTFLGAVRTLELFGPRIVEVALDAQGMRVDELERHLKRLDREGVRPKLIYTLPNFQNPAGVTLSLARRRKLLTLAEEYGVPILEDDAYGELRFEGRPLPSLLALDTGGLVIRCGTFSKILGAGLRLGWMAGPERHIKRLVSLKVDGGTNPLASKFAATFAREGHLERHIRLLRRVYRERRDAMIEALEEHCADYATWTRPQGGFFVWVTLNPEVDPDRAFEAAREHGVSYLRGTACYASGRGADELRLAFSFLPADHIRAGIARLGEALRSTQRVAVAAGA